MTLKTAKLFYSEDNINILTLCRLETEVSFESVLVEIQNHLVISPLKVVGTLIQSGIF